MKIRNGFVTNSSSSSYIIGKRQNEDVTVESVYQLIRGFYKKSYEKLDALRKHINDHPNLCLSYEKSKYGNYYGFEFTDSGRFSFYTKNKIESKLHKKYGVSIYGYFEDVPEWVNCETYENYKEYWLHKFDNAAEERVFAPFTIVDFLEERSIFWLHWKTLDTHKVNSQSDILGWYCEYADKIFNSDSCENCADKDCKWCDKTECDKERAKIVSQNIPEDKACLYLLGRVCVCSESGFMPEGVTEKLADISEFYCHHMG